MDDLISIIVPVYNAAQYVEQLLQSFSLQTYKKFEIIIVDDGSTDDTLMRIQKLKQKMKESITVLTQSNSGVSAARNLGLQNAIGKYIVFVDSDDYVDEDYLKTLHLPFESSKDIDLSIVGYVSQYENGDSKYHTSGSLKKMSFDEAIYNAFILFSYEGYPWNKMYKKALIDKYQLKFNTDITVCEDLLFFVDYTLHSKYVYYNPTPMYHYVLHQSSTINGRSVGKPFNQNALTELSAYDLMESTVPKKFKNIHNIMLVRRTWTNSYLSRLIYAAPNSDEFNIEYNEMRKFQFKHATYFLFHAKYDFAHKLLFSINLFNPKLIRRMDIRRRERKML